MFETVPFTYFIGWHELDAYYVGVRYGKGCNPESLWTTYFTSSWMVQGLANQFGPPDVIEVIATYDTPQQAIEAERAMILDYGLIGHRSFLNCWAGAGIYLTDEEQEQRAARLKVFYASDEAAPIRAARSSRMTDLWSDPVRREELLRSRAKARIAKPYKRKRNQTHDRRNSMILAFDGTTNEAARHFGLHITTVRAIWRRGARKNGETFDPLVHILDLP